MSQSQPNPLQQPFGQLVQMLVQHAGLALGKIPHPVTGEAKANLPMARHMLDHLKTLQQTTTGNIEEAEQVLIQEARDSLEGYYNELQQAEANQTTAPNQSSPAKPEGSE